MAGLAVVGVLVYLVYLLLWLGSEALLALGASVRGEVAEGLRPFTARAAAIGLLVMALIQVVRGIYPVRGLFHEWQLRRWLQAESFDLVRKERVRDLARELCTLWDQPVDSAIAQRWQEARKRLPSPAAGEAWQTEDAWCWKAASEIVVDRKPLEEGFAAAWEKLEVRASEPLIEEWTELHLSAWYKAAAEGRTDRYSTFIELETELEDERDALEAFAEIATHSNRRELFDLPLEQLCGQIGATAEEILTDPTGRVRVLAGLTGVREALTYFEAWKRHWRKREAAQSRTREASDVDREFSAIRSTIGLRIQRNIDSFQVFAGVRWRRGLRIAALVSSAVFACGLVLDPSEAIETGFSARSTWQLLRTVQLETLFELLVTSVVAGYLATVARDLVAVVERLRG